MAYNINSSVYAFIMVQFYPGYSLVLMMMIQNKGKFILDCTEGEIEPQHLNTYCNQEV